MSTATTLDVQHYLATLYPEVPDTGWLVVSWRTPESLRSQWIAMQERVKAVHVITRHAGKTDVYIGVGLRHPRCTPSPASRGGNEDVWVLAGLHVDLDHNQGVHASPHLPTPAVLLDFMHRQPFVWSLVVDTGGGFQGFLLFKEPWLLETTQERARAELLLTRFQRTLQLQASAAGWHIDSTADLSRILRPAGTLNYKTDPPCAVTIAHEDSTRYNPSDLADMPWMVTIEESYLPEASHSTVATNGTTPFPPTSLPLIQQGCAWMQHCFDDAATLSEPEWYAMLSIGGRCAEGETAMHEWSLPYPRYTRVETTRKLRHARDAPGPHTCGYIRYSLDAERFCRDCPHWGKVKSPIVLGLPQQPDVLTGQLSVDERLAVPVGFSATGGKKKRGKTGDTEETTAPGAPPSVPRRASTDFDLTRQTQWYKDKVALYENKRQIVEANDTTICAFLRNHAYWQGKLWWNAMANRPMIGEHALDDHLLVEIGEYFGQHHHLPIRTSATKLAKCFATVCYAHQRDPLREYLDSLAGWDGVPRLDTWLTDCAGVATDDYHAFVSRMLIVSMIARAFEPGCLYRFVVVLQGPEEYRKSTFVSQMVPYEEWQDTITESFESKDMPMLIAGLWIAELSELDSLTRTEETRLKSFISKRVDSYVPKWALFRTSQERRTIFIGTTNEQTWLRSSSGNTRWLPVKILHPMDVELFVSMREQLYAEAMCIYGDHRVDWWKMTPAVHAQALIEREQRRQAHIYEDDLPYWLETGRFYCPRLRTAGITSVHHEISWSEIAIGFLQMDSPEKWKDLNVQKQIYQSLKALGWTQIVTRREGKSVRRWVYSPAQPF